MAADPFHAKLTSELPFRSSTKSEMSISPTSLATWVRRPGLSRPPMMWGLLWVVVAVVTDWQTGYFKLLLLLQKRQGMDIKQMKAFVSEELKGLKQEHRLLSLRESYRSSLWVWGQMSLSQRLISFADISASESIMKTKTNQDFQELLRIEHCRNHRIFTSALVAAGALFVSDFKFRCCSFTWGVWNPGMYFVHRGTHHQTGAFGLIGVSNISGIILKKTPFLIFKRPPWQKVWGFFVFCPSLKTVSSVCFNVTFKMCERLFFLPTCCLSTGLLPKEYRSLKTQFLQVRRF